MDFFFKWPFLQGGDATPCKARGEKARVFMGLNHSDWKEGGETAEWLFPVGYGTDSQCRQQAGSRQAGSSALTGQLAKAMTQLDQRSSVISGLTAL